MKILYNSDIFDLLTHGGISRSFVELVRHFSDDVQADFAVLETDNVHLKDFMNLPSRGAALDNFLSGKNIPGKRFLFKLIENFKRGYYKNWDIYPPINRDYSHQKLKSGDYDIFHPTFFFDDFLPFLGETPFVMTIHDLIADLYPEYNRTAEVKGRIAMIPHAKHFVAVSNQTKSDMIRLYNIPEDKITVIYHGQDETPYIPSLNNKRDYEYILFTGTRHDYKNFMPFAKQCFPILKKHKDLKVICTSGDFTEEELTFFRENGMEDRFVHFFAKTDQDLYDLYHYAIAFVFPSLYEGFGIPILEAYKANCPVMLTPYSCFPEIAGDAAIYFELKDEKSDFIEKFENLYHLDSNERTDIIVKQQERLKLFSWKKASNELASVYRDILK